MSKKDINEELDGLAPLLGRLKKMNPEEEGLPVNYFDNFGARLQQRLETEAALDKTRSAEQAPEQRTWQAYWLSVKQWLLNPGALATACLLLALTVSLFWMNDSEADAETLFVELEEQEATNYLLQHVDDLETADLVALVSTEDLQELEAALQEPLLEQTITTATTSQPATSPVEAASQKEVWEEAEGLIDELTEEDLEFLEDEALF